MQLTQICSVDPKLLPYILTDLSLLLAGSVAGSMLVIVGVWLRTGCEVSITNRMKKPIAQARSSKYIELLIAKTKFMFPSSINMFFSGLKGPLNAQTAFDENAPP